MFVYFGLIMCDTYDYNYKSQHPEYRDDLYKLLELNNKEPWIEQIVKFLSDRTYCSEYGDRRIEMCFIAKTHARIGQKFYKNGIVENNGYDILSKDKRYEYLHKWFCDTISFLDLTEELNDCLTTTGNTNESLMSRDSIKAFVTYCYIWCSKARCNMSETMKKKLDTLKESLAFAIEIDYYYGFVSVANNIFPEIKGDGINK